MAGGCRQEARVARCRRYRALIPAGQHWHRQARSWLLRGVRQLGRLSSSLMVAPDPADPACDGVVHADRVAASQVNRFGGESAGGTDHEGTQIGVLHQRLDIDLAQDLVDVDPGHEPIYIQPVDYLVQIYPVDYLVQIYSRQHDI